MIPIPKFKKTSQQTKSAMEHAAIEASNNRKAVAFLRRTLNEIADGLERGTRLQFLAARAAAETLPRKLSGGRGRRRAVTS